MRRTLAAMITLGVLACAPLASAEKTKLVTTSPVFSARGDAALVLRASRVRELPRTLGAGDRKLLVATAATLRAGRLDAARRAFAHWAKRASRRVPHEDTILAALWVVREGAVADRPELVEAADRVRFHDERVEALTNTIAELNVVASQSGVTPVRFPVPVRYARLEPGNEKRAVGIAREELPTRLAQMEAELARATAERDAVRAEFARLERDHRPLMETVLVLVRAAAAAHDGGDRPAA